MKSEWYTAYFTRLDSNGKAREIRFGKEQSLLTDDSREAFETCQKIANETGEGITINHYIETAVRKTKGSPAMGGAFYDSSRCRTTRINKYPIYPEPDHRQRAGGAANEVQGRDETV